MRFPAHSVSVVELSRVYAAKYGSDLGVPYEAAVASIPDGIMLDARAGFAPLLREIERRIDDLAPYYRASPTLRHLRTGSTCAYCGGRRGGNRSCEGCGAS